MARQFAGLPGRADDRHGGLLLLPPRLDKRFTGRGCQPGDFLEGQKTAAEALPLTIYAELEQVKLEYVVERVRAFYGLNTI